MRSQRWFLSSNLIRCDVFKCLLWKDCFQDQKTVNLCIDWAKGCSDYTLFLGVSVRVSPDDISIWTIGLEKADAPPQGEWPPSNPLRAWTENAEKRRIYHFLLPTCPLELRHLSSPILGLAFTSWLPGFLDLRIQTRITPPTSWVSSLQTADRRISQPP